MSISREKKPCTEPGLEDANLKSSEADTETILSNGNRDGLKRRLGNRQIQLVAIGASIGTALFISTGHALEKAGPGSLLIAFILQCAILSMVNNCIAEMGTYMPVSGGFIRMAGKWVDDAFGFMAGWNFFIYQVVTIPFEITALNIVLSYWSSNIPTAAICAGCIACYAFLNIMAVGVYGETEFWLSGGKVVLILIVFSFTFISMVGGNPRGDAYGFRYWDTPGPFAEYLTTGSESSGRFQGFLAALWSAAFTCVGPEYISMISAESKHPRIYVKSAYKTVYWRFCIFYVGSALACGIVVAYNDPTLIATSSGSTGASSPYVIAMGNLGIGILPHIVNALLVTSIFSAGNGCTYYATRILYGLALEGRAPKILTKTTKKGVTIYCFAVVMVFPFLSFLQLSNNSAVVLDWLVDLSTASIVINYIVIAVTYIFFYRACVAQSFDRSRFPYRGWLQPWCGYISAAWMLMVVIFYGYTVFEPWSLTDFIIDYILVLLMPVLYVGWKVVHRTKIVPSKEADLRWDALQITAYEEAFSAIESPTGFWREMVELFMFRKTKNSTEVIQDC